MTEDRGPQPPPPPQPPEVAWHSAGLARPPNEASQTDWSMIFQAAHVARSQPRSGESALERVTRRYWPAIYAFIRSSGADVDVAADLTQGFVCDVLLGRELLADADPARGRFRSLLMSAVRNYVRERHRHNTRKKRAPDGVAPLRLDHQQLAEVVHDGRTPERAFSSQWAVTLIHQVLDRIRADCEQCGWERHWAVFERRVVQPLLFGAPPQSYADITRDLNLRDESQAANMMISVKRRVARAMLEEVAHTLEDPSLAEDELRTILRELEHS